MSSIRKPNPDKKNLLFSILIVLAVAYAIYFAFNSLGIVEQIVAVSAEIVIVFPLLKMPMAIEDNEDSITLKTLLGSKCFKKKDYTIQRVSEAELSSIRLFATSAFLHWGYFRNKSFGTYYAICLNPKNAILLTRKSDGGKIVIDSPWE